MGGLRGINQRHSVSRTPPLLTPDFEAFFDWRSFLLSSAVALASFGNVSASNMNLRFGHQQLPARLEASLHFAQVAALSTRDSRTIIKANAKSTWASTPRPSCSHVMKSNAICDTRRRRSLPKHIEHLLLEIDGDDSAAAPTIFAIAIENNPIPQPTSITVMPAYVGTDDFRRLMNSAEAGCR